jgi:hypothetical protein
MRRGLLQALVAVAAGLLLLAGVLALGGWARQRLRQEEARSVPLDDLDVQPPDGLSRGEFLAEVRSLASLPDRLPLLDPDLPGMLARAFAGHPEVEGVGRVEVLPGRRVRALVTYRRAALAVSLPPGCTPEGGGVLVETRSGVGQSARVLCRAVDRSGILLPARATRGGVPVLSTEVDPPAGPAGTAWGDARVQAAAAVAGLLAPHLARLGLADTTVDFEGANLVLSRPSLRLLWGRPPGEEFPGEAPAGLKVGRLLESREGPGGLAGDYDLRPAEGPRHFPLPRQGP